MDASIETPAFVVDEALLLEQVASFRNALDQHWPGSVLSYSVKTNSLPWLVAWMGRHGVPAEIVSEEEWDLALRLGHDPSQLIVNGPVKTPRLLAEAFDAGAVVNLDSRRELRWTIERAQAGGHIDGVGLRVNWDVDRDAPGHTSSGPEGLRFGFHADNGDLNDAIASLRAAGVPIRGLHLHVTSLTRALDTYLSAGHAARRIIHAHELDLEWLDMGGGFFGGPCDRFPTPDQYLTAIRESIGDAVDPATTHLILEPGAALVAVPFELHTSVIDSKPVQDHLIVVTDGSRTNLDPFLRKSYYKHTITSAGEPCHTPQVISGFTCLDNDRLMVLQEAPRLTEGDRIVYHTVGSYTMTFNPLFIQYLPRVYARHADSSLSVVRERWGVDEYLAGNSW
ncbi:MAG: hypothetical protein Q4D79_12785 [Propionibacteriaceae bacterium]|nr:hypothetical protein [Propionibacteriaceae bacterium]